MTARALTKETSRRAFWAVAIFLTVAAVIALTARDAGLTWDEAIYYGRAARYADWFARLSSRSFTAQEIFSHWWSKDHPPLGSLWIAMSGSLFGSRMDLITATRVGAGLLFGAAAAAIFLWLASKRSERAGFVAAAIFVLMPRLFAHGHFANLEMATLLLWLLTVISFERGIERRGWSVACGVFFGLALLTKINALFLPVLLLPWGFLFHGRKALRNVAAMAICGPLVFCAGWPVMWYHPLVTLRVYLADKMQRMVIPVFYLGTEYRDRIAPWHYPFVMLLATTPLPVLAAAALGLWRHLRALRFQHGGTEDTENTENTENGERVGNQGNQLTPVASLSRSNPSLLSAFRASVLKKSVIAKDSSHEALVIWAFLFPVCLLALPGVPKYDGIRLMLPAYPFLAALAAAGAVAAWDYLGRAGKGVRAASVAVFAAWLLLPVAALHPYQLCYYGELVGGPRGAAKLGFETTYWDDTFDEKALDWLNKNVLPDGKVAFVAVGDYLWQYYQRLGEVRPDIAETEFAGDWDYLVVVPRQGWWTDAERAFIRMHQPVWTNTPWAVGAPVCMIYKR